MKYSTDSSSPRQSAKELGGIHKDIATMQPALTSLANIKVESFVKPQLICK